MRIVKVDPVPYTLPFYNCPLKKKEGYIVTFHFENGSKKQGDLSPLPGWSKESATEALAELKKIEGCAQKQALSHLTLPSSYFALAEALEKPQAYTKPICGLYFSLPIQWSETCIKVKMGDRGYQEALNWFDKLSLATKVRVDLNQKWSLKEALIFAHKVNPIHIDYIEEPHKNLEDLVKFSQNSSLPLALDETLRQFDFTTLLNSLSFDVVVIKPTLHMGYESLIQEAKRAGKRIVLSSSFESELGLHQIKALALKHDLCEVHGLGTDRYAMPH